MWTCLNRLSNQLPWAAGTQQWWWWPWQCKWRQRCKECWSWSAPPVSSGCPPDGWPPPPAPTGLLPLASLGLLTAAHQPAVWFPAISSPPTTRSQLYPVRSPAVPAVAGGTPGGIQSFGCWRGAPLRPKEALRVILGPRLLACPEGQRRSERAWGCRWASGAPPAGSDGFQPELWGLPAGSLGPSAPPAADSSAPTDERLKMCQPRQISNYMNISWFYFWNFLIHRLYSGVSARRISCRLSDKANVTFLQLLPPPKRLWFCVTMVTCVCVCVTIIIRDPTGDYIWDKGNN